MNKIKAVVIADSISVDDIRLTTLEILAPKFIDAQLRTHRMLSQNSSSSRAIPTQKLIDQVGADPYIPISWRLNEPGMQGYAELDKHLVSTARYNWMGASQEAILYARRLLRQGIHKQTANRLLEPFLLQKKVITATEWDNFFDLRLKDDAQPEIQ